MSSTIYIDLKYREAQAVKHALQKQLEERKDYLKVYGFEMVQDEKEQLEKDIEQEKNILEELIEKIDAFKKRNDIK